MTSNPFDRVIWNTREKPLSPDWNRALTQDSYAMRLMMREMFATRAETTTPGVQPSTNPSNGFVGLGISAQPQATPGMSVVLKSGLGFMDVPTDEPTSINGVVGLDDAFSYKPVVLANDLTVAVPAAPVSNSRIDLIEVRPNRQVTDPQTRLILNTNTGGFDPLTVNKTLQYTLDGSAGYVNDPSPSTAAIGYKQGVAAASPVAPLPTAGYLPVAYISVASTTTAITFSQISDQRRLLFPGGCATWSAMWNLTQTPLPSATQTIAAVRISAPPGIQVALIQAANSYAYQVFCLGGKLQSCPMTFSVGVNSNGDGSETNGPLPFVVVQTANADAKSPGGGNAPAWTSFFSGLGGVTLTPNINAGPLANYARAYINLAGQNAGTSASTATSGGAGDNLRNLCLTVSGVCRW